MPSDAVLPRPAGAQLAYGAISGALLLPVVAWPWLWFARAGLEVAAEAVQAWMIAAAMLFVAAAVADSLLGWMARARDGRMSDWALFFTAGWVLFGVLAASLALRLDQGAFALGVLFALHALRSARALWRGDAVWWLWPAWGRDVLAALSLFYWFARLGHG